MDETLSIFAMVIGFGAVICTVISAQAIPKFLYYRRMTGIRRGHLEVTINGELTRIDLRSNDRSENEKLDHVIKSLRLNDDAALSH